MCAIRELRHHYRNVEMFCCDEYGFLVPIYLMRIEGIE